MERNPLSLKNTRPPAPWATPRSGGAFPLSNGSRFVLNCPRAGKIDLHLFDAPDQENPTQTASLHADQNRFGDLWAIEVPEARENQYYVWQIDDEPHWVLDPYAEVICRPHGRDDFDQSTQPPEHPTRGATFPKARVAPPAFDWGDDRFPRIPLADTVYYEIHVRGFTKMAKQTESRPGTYAALTEQLPYMKDLGITTIELLPIHEFNPHEYYMDKDAFRSHLRNFWGYSSLAFFAPHGGYAADDRGAQANELKSFIKAAHAIGLEVVLDVVYNHTAEGGKGGPAYSFKHIDPERFYMVDQEGNHANYTGCGNTVNANHPETLRFIMESLRYWVSEYHIDGFRFDLATCLGRGQDGALMRQPPLIQAIDEDPVLSGIKLISEAWDAAGGYQVPDFPGRHWSVWNGRYRDDVREFWKGEAGMLPDLVNCLLGSPDMYKPTGHPTFRSVNLLTCHDGFTLADLTRYESKHNLANGEENRDGENHNHSLNFGVEGDTDDPEILRLRRRQQKNLIATLFLSQGTPLLLGGDEFARTQMGSNNAYCQDNEVSWVDWSFAEENADLLAFTREVIEFRKTHPPLRCRRFLDDWNAAAPSGRVPDIEWHGPIDTGLDWRGGRSIGFFLNAQANPEESDPKHRSLFIILNANTETRTFELPYADQLKWETALLTCEPDEVTCTTSGITVPSRSVVVFETHSRLPAP